MSAGRTIWRRPARILALAVALAAASRPANAGAAETDAETGNAIESARSDYEAITAAKAGRTPSQLPLPKQAMPRLDLKSDVLPAPPSPAYRKSGDANAPRGEQARENWLVEAMNQTAAEPAKAGEDSSETAAEIETPQGDLLATAAALERAEQAAAKAREAREEKDGEIQAFNPLEAYMAGWLSTRDPVRTDIAIAARMDREPIKRAGLAAPMGNPAQHAGDWALSMTDLFNSISDRPGSPAAGAPGTNPYLAETFRAWGDGASSAPLAVLPPNTAPMLHSPEPFRREPATAAESKTPPRLSEELKAQDDAKYFKQLKRF